MKQNLSIKKDIMLEESYLIEQMIKNRNWYNCYIVDNYIKKNKTNSVISNNPIDVELFEHLYKALKLIKKGH